MTSTNVKDSDRGDSERKRQIFFLMKTKLRTAQVYASKEDTECAALHDKCGEGEERGEEESKVENVTFSFEPVVFEEDSGDVQWTVRYINLEFRKEN